MPEVRLPCAAPAAPVRGRPAFRAEFADFLAFVRRPRLGPRLPRTTGQGSQEWLGGLGGPHLLRWVLVLWGVNLLVLGPLAASVATASGAERRLDALHLSWFHVVLWAPVIEEMVFRYGLRRPAAALWLLPVLVSAMLMRPSLAAGASVALACGAIAAVLVWRGHRWPWKWLRRYARVFPLVFHLATLAFAFLHLANFRLGEGGWLLLPLLVLP